MFVRAAAALGWTAFAALATAVHAAQPVAWTPEKSVELISPSSPGGGTDNTVRLMQRIWQDKRFFEMPVNVVNKPGCGQAVSLAYLRQYYLDLDDCVEWSGYQFIPDQLMHYMKPIRQPPTKVMTIDGLYLASATVEGKGAWIDREAEAAINAANLATQEFGPFLKSRKEKETAIARH